LAICLIQLNFVYQLRSTPYHTLAATTFPAEAGTQFTDPDGMEE
jgi:hypothetical protein